MDVLRSTTSPRWLELALADFDAVLCDHAHCERKAAASAMSLITAYPDCDELVSKLAKLAQEELRHFQAVHRIIRERRLTLPRDSGDPYAQRLVALVRAGSPAHRRTDRLLVSALIEARSAERLGLLAEGLSDPALRDFYATLTTAEAGHYRLFVKLAERYDDGSEVETRLATLAVAEAEIVASLPLEPRIH